MTHPDGFGFAAGQWVTVARGGAERSGTPGTLRSALEPRRGGGHLRYAHAADVHLPALPHRVQYGELRVHHRAELRPRLWEYLGGAVRGEGGIPVLVSGTADHAHLFATLNQQQALANVVRKLKAGSSRWMHGTFPDARVWPQTGYGAFTVSHSGREAVTAYVANQEEHHKRVTYQDKVRALLKRQGLGMDSDERYAWG